MNPSLKALGVEAGRIVRFGFVGVLSTATHVLVALGLVSFVALDPVLASIGGFIFAFTISFVGHKRISFRAPGRYREYIGRFSVAVIVSFVASTGIVALLTHVFSVDATITFITVGVAVPLMNYLFGRFWVFLGRSTADTV